MDNYRVSIISLHRLLPSHMAISYAVGDAHWSVPYLSFGVLRRKWNDSWYDIPTGLSISAVNATNIPLHILCLFVSFFVFNIYIETSVYTQSDDRYLFSHYMSDSAFSSSQNFLSICHQIKQKRYGEFPFRGSHNPKHLPFLFSWTFIADQNVIWYGTSLWSVRVRCPSCVPSQTLAHPQPTCCGGKSEKKKKPPCCASAAQWQPTLLC